MASLRLPSCAMRSIPALLVIFIAHASAFVSPSGLLNVRGPHSASIRRPGATQGICMFEWGRFAKTLTFFNGNPLLKLVGFAKTPSVPRPEPTQNGVFGRETVLWGFDDMTDAQFAALWAPLDDVVMGGVSSSEIVRAPHGATLRGATSSRNNGGFCSARTRNVDPGFNIEGRSAIAVRVKCDKGMRYKIILRDREGWDTVAWCHSFDARKGQWMDLKVPLKEFIPVFRGTTLKGADRPAAIDAASIYSAQMMLSKYEYDGGLNPNFQEGPFELQFGPIRAV